MGPEASGRHGGDQSLLSRGPLLQAKSDWNASSMRAAGLLATSQRRGLSEGLRADSEQMEGGWEGRQSAGAGPAHQACAARLYLRLGGPDLRSGTSFYVAS